MRIKRSKEFITLPPLAQRIWRRSAQLSSKYFLPLFPRKNARNKKLLSDIRQFHSSSRNFLQDFFLFLVPTIRPVSLSFPPLFYPRQQSLFSLSFSIQMDKNSECRGVSRWGRVSSLVNESWGCRMEGRTIIGINAINSWETFVTPIYIIKNMYARASGRVFVPVALPLVKPWLLIWRPPYSTYVL